MDVTDLTNPSSAEGEVSMGTSLVAVTFDKGVVIGADSRTSTGVYVASRASNKLTKLTEKIYLCRSGSAADTQAIADYVTHFLSNHSLDIEGEPLVATAAHMCRNISYQNKEYLSAGLICAGYDDKNGGSVYSIPIGGAIVQLPFTISGSGSTYIYGFMDANYREGCSREEAEDLVKRGLTLAMGRDGSSGGVIRMVTLTAEGVDRTFVPGDEIPV